MALSDNQVAYYKLDESSGNAADSVASQTLTNNNTVAFSAGKINNGADFGTTNTNKYFSRTDALGFTTNSSVVISVSMWVYFKTGFGNSDATMLLSIGSANTFHMIFNVRGNSGGSAGVDMEVYLLGATGINNSVAQSFALNTWYHLVWVVNGSSYTFYVNGSSIGSGTMSYPSNTTFSAFTLLGGNDIGSNMRGLIDEVGIWNRALTSGDVTSLYNSGSGKQYPYGAVYSLVCAVGTFALTGVAAILQKAMHLVMATGTFTLTGIATLFKIGRGIIAGIGSFILTGYNAIVGSKWTKQAKNTTSYSNQSKNSSIWTDQTKN